MDEPATIHIRATHSHLYPGARGRIEGARDGPCLVEFADGGSVPGELSGRRLWLAAHRTAAGTEIPEKIWQLEIVGGRFRVMGRG